MGPATVGAGRLLVQISDRLAWSWCRTARGPLPPPDRVSGAKLAAGERLPSVLVCRVVSTFTQPPSREIRSGTSLRFFWKKAPSGCAVTVLNESVNSGIGTGTPVSCAFSEAVCAPSGSSYRRRGNTGDENAN